MILLHIKIQIYKCFQLFKNCPSKPSPKDGVKLGLFLSKKRRIDNLCNLLFTQSKHLFINRSASCIPTLVVNHSLDIFYCFL